MSTVAAITKSPLQLAYRCDHLFFSAGPWLAVAAVGLLPVRLNVSYIFLLPLISLWIIRFCLGTVAMRRSETPASLRLFAAFVCCAAVSAVFGINPARSLTSLARLLFYASVVGVIVALIRQDVLKRSAIVLALVVGQSLAALHTVLSGVGLPLPPLFTGPVTESGQLALTLVAALGLLLALNEEIIAEVVGGNSGALTRTRYRVYRNTATVLGVLFAFVFILGSVDSLGIQQYVTPGVLRIVTLVLPLCGGTAYWWFRKVSLQRQLALLIGLLLVLFPVMTAALVVNLKRGPWFGVLVGVSLLLLCYARRFLVPLVSTTLLVLVLVAPVRERLLRSSDHFFIAGGRNELWDIGVELATRYPLGIGFDNSRFLQRFSQDIPPELTHFHNNFLNILVETGWCSLALFLVWLGVVVGAGFGSREQRGERLLATGVSCALLSWQLAGIVEYNVGDSEVLIIAFILSALVVRTHETREVAA